MSLKPRITVALLVVGGIALAIVLGTKISGRLDKRALVAKEAAAKQATLGQKPTPVLVRPLPGPTRETLRLTGSLRPEAEVALGFKVPGRLTELGAKRGDVVHAGQFLARLDGRDLDAQAAQADAGRKAAEAQSAVATDALSRAKALHDAGAATSAQLITAGGQSAAIDASIEQAGAARRYIDVVRGETRLSSPIDGVVVSAPSAPGFVVQMMSPPVFVIQRLSVLRFTGHLVDRDAARVQAGMAIELESDAGVLARGIVDAMVPSADLLTRRVPVEATVPNADGKLFAGSMVEARIDVPAEPTLSVPMSTLLTGTDPQLLVVGADRKLERRVISVLRTEKDRLLLRSGVGPDEVVLANPGVDWREGEQVPADALPKLEQAAGGR